MAVNLVGARDGNEVELPQDLDSIVIETALGGLHISLHEQVPGMVVIRPVSHDAARRNAGVRLIASPMDNGRLAVGVIQSP